MSPTSFAGPATSTGPTRGGTSVSRRAIPFVDLGRQHAPLRDEIADAINGVIDTSAFILGPDVRAFEDEWATYCQADHAVGVGSGTAALHLTLLALEVGPGDEVIVPANSFVASALPVLYVGATLVLVDCEEETALIDVSAVEAAVTERTRAVIPVHLYGQAADLDPLLGLAASYGFDVIEDACQAHGARYRGRRVGAIGRAGCFSFYPSKNLGALADGGAIVTADAELADRLRRLRDLGQRQKYDHVVAGYNERLDTLQAAVLRVKLHYLEEWNEARRDVAAVYGEALDGLPLGIPAYDGDREHVWHLYVIRSPRRDVMRSALTDAGIATGLHYPTPIHLQQAFSSLGHALGSFPASEAWSKECLSLPMFPELEAHEIEAVAQAIRSTDSRS